MKLKTSCLSIVVLSIAVLAGCATEPKPGAVIVDENDPQRVVCKNDPNTGSRLPKKTCKTAQEWEDIAAANQLAKRNLRRSEELGVGGISPSGSGN